MKLQSVFAMDEFEDAEFKDAAGNAVSKMRVRFLVDGEQFDIN